MEQEKKTYVASISYGKDSLAMLHVITDVLHWPLDRIITADVWATDTITADLPAVAKFKKEADKIIRDWWGITVEHFYAIRNGEKYTFEKEFYRKRTAQSGVYAGDIVGWPMAFGHSWCNGVLKKGALNIMRKNTKGAVEYVGIAADEPKRIKRHANNCVMPLVEAEWTEAMCRDWCKQNGLLSPTYATQSRDGCWFCINQPLSSLRNLRCEHPDLYGMMLKWDADSIADNPQTNKKFRADGRTLHDVERRFRWEDEGYLPTGPRFRWSDTEEAQMNIFQFIGNGGDEHEAN